MDQASLILVACNLLCGLLLVGLFLPLLRDKIGRNSLYGFRFPQSLASDENWYAINRYGARKMLRWTPAIFLAGLMPMFIPLSNRPLLALFFGLVPMVILIPCLQTYLYARKFSSDE